LGGESITNQSINPKIKYIIAELYNIEIHSKETLICHSLVTVSTVVFILAFLSTSECFYARGQKLFQLKPALHKQKISWNALTEKSK